MGDSVGDMVGDICLVRPRLGSTPGDRVRGLMGAGRRLGEELDKRREELMEGLLSEDCSWQLLRDAWMEGLLREVERPAGTRTYGGLDQTECWRVNEEKEPACSQPFKPNTGLYCVRGGGGAGESNMSRKTKSGLLCTRRGSEFLRHFVALPDARTKREQEWV